MTYTIYLCVYIYIPYTCAACLHKIQGYTPYAIPYTCVCFHKIQLYRFRFTSIFNLLNCFTTSNTFLKIKKEKKKKTECLLSISQNDIGFYSSNLVCGLRFMLLSAQHELEHKILWVSWEGWGIWTI